MKHSKDNFQVLTQTHLIAGVNDGNRSLKKDEFLKLALASTNQNHKQIRIFKAVPLSSETAVRIVVSI